MLFVCLLLVIFSASLLSSFEGRRWAAARPYTDIVGEKGGVQVAVMTSAQ